MNKSVGEPPSWIGLSVRGVSNLGRQGQCRGMVVQMEVAGVLKTVLTCGKDKQGNRVSVGSINE
jgi:hypothetical protein